MLALLAGMDEVLAADGDRVLIADQRLPNGVGRAKVFGARPVPVGVGAATACVPARTTTRIAAGNPVSYTASRAVLGGQLELACDLSTTGHLAAWFFAFESPARVPLSGGQVLLCLNQGQGELFTGTGVGPVVSSMATFELSVPVDSSMCGKTLYSQAVHVFGPVFALSNAQDIQLGR